MGNLGDHWQHLYRRRGSFVVVVLRGMWKAVEKTRTRDLMVGGGRRDTRA